MPPTQNEIGKERSARLRAALLKMLQESPEPLPRSELIKVSIGEGFEPYPPPQVDAFLWRLVHEQKVIKKNADGGYVMTKKGENVAQANGSHTEGEEPAGEPVAAETETTAEPQPHPRRRQKMGSSKKKAVNKSTTKGTHFSQRERLVNAAKQRSAILACLNGSSGMKRSEIWNIVSDQMKVTESSFDNMLKHMKDKKILDRDDEGLYTVTDPKQAMAATKNWSSPKALQERGKMVRMQLLEILREKGPMRLGQLAQATRLKSGNLSAYLNALKNEGAVMRGVDGWMIGEDATAGEGGGAPKGQRIRLEYTLYVGRSKLFLSDEDATNIVKTLAGRLKV